MYITDVIKLPSSNNSVSVNSGLINNKPTFNQPEQPFPDNGSTIKYFSEGGVAPFQVITPSGDLNYFIKVVDWSSKQPIISIFVHSGQTADVKLPLGSYEVKYATGEKWYGEKYLFGPDTSYNKADTRLDFTQSGNRFQGHTIKLIPQTGGNLRTSKISPSDF